MPRPKLKVSEPPAREDYHWSEIAEALRAKPGTWMLVHENIPANVVWTVNRGGVAAVHPDLGFRTSTAKNTRPETGPRMAGEVYMVYEPELDESRAKQNGGKR